MFCVAPLLGFVLIYYHVHIPRFTYTVPDTILRTLPLFFSSIKIDATGTLEARTGRGIAQSILVNIPDLHSVRPSLILLAKPLGTKKSL